MTRSTVALLSGLLGNIGCKSGNRALPRRARHQVPDPPSPRCTKKAGKWIMAAEITETTTCLRCVARIEDGWIEKVGAHLIKRQYFDPHWGKEGHAGRRRERTTSTASSSTQAAHPLRPAALAEAR